MLGHVRGHRWRYPQRLVNPTEVVVHEVQRHRVAQVFDALAERIRQPCVPSHRHPHRQVLALHERRTHHVRIGSPLDNFGPGADAGWRAVTRLGRAVRTVAFPLQLHEHGVVDVRSERALDGFEVGAVPVGSQLHAGRGKAASEIIHKIGCRCSRAVPDAPRRDQLRVGAHCRPGPHVASFWWRRLGARQRVLLGVHEGPYFVALDALTRQIAQRLVLIFGARFPGVDEQLGDRVARYVGDAGR